MDFFDLHCDTASHLRDFDERLDEATGHISLKKAQGFDRWAQVFAIFINDSRRGASAAQQYFVQRDILKEQVRLFSRRLALCSGARQMENAFEEGRAAMLLSVENGAALGGNLEMLAQFKADGVRFLTLTWFGENELGFGSQVGGPLKPFGLRVLEKLPEYGIVPDVSHLSDEGLETVFERCQGPLVATHSDCRAARDHFRNLTRPQVEGIVKRKGLIGLNLCNEFLNENKEKASIDDVYRHASWFLEWGAEDVLCSGTDFDGAEVPRDIGALDGMERVKEYFLQRGIPEALADGIFFENARRFCLRNF